MFRARGNEPGWRLDIVGDRMTLVTQYGEKRLVTATPAAQRTDTFTRYAARVEGSDVTATIFNRACKDTMTGMPHPHAVEVVLDEKKLTGCGGDPAALLQGREWVVEDINGRGIIDRSRATLNFGPDGRVSGRSSCNNYTAQYSLTGEGLTVSKAAGTMMACEPALMQQESRFLDVLQNVRRFDLGPDGALILRTDDRRTITARR
jgi:heat shock protein HslJ